MKTLRSFKNIVSSMIMSRPRSRDSEKGSSMLRHDRHELSESAYLQGEVAHYYTRREHTTERRRLNKI